MRPSKGTCLRRRRACCGSETVDVGRAAAPRFWKATSGCTCSCKASVSTPMRMRLRPSRASPLTPRSWPLPVAGSPSCGLVWRLPSSQQRRRLHPLRPRPHSLTAPRARRKLLSPLVPAAPQQCFSCAAPAFLGYRCSRPRGLSRPQRGWGRRWDGWLGRGSAWVSRTAVHAGGAPTIP